LFDYVPATIQDLFQTVDVLELLTIHQLAAAKEHPKLNNKHLAQMIEMTSLTVQ